MNNPFKAGHISTEVFTKRQHERLDSYLTQMFSLLVDEHHKITNLTGNISLFKCNCGCQLEFFVTSIPDKTAKLFLTTYQSTKNARECQNTRKVLPYWNKETIVYNIYIETTPGVPMLYLQGKVAYYN